MRCRIPWPMKDDHDHRVEIQRESGKQILDVAETLSPGRADGDEPGQQILEAMFAISVVRLLNHSGAFSAIPRNNSSGVSLGPLTQVPQSRPMFS